MTDSCDDKKQIRNQILSLRKSLAAEDRRQSFEGIRQSILTWPLFQRSRTLMIYLSMPDEVPTDPLIELSISEGKCVCVPMLESAYGVMSAAQIHSLAALTVGKFGLRTPDPEHVERVSPAAIDLVLVPAVAFDRSGNRLGFGSGYYDRFLPQAAKAVFLGLAWECQITEEIPYEPHDVKMHYLLTEKGFWRCGESE